MGYGWKIQKKVQATPKVRCDTTKSVVKIKMCIFEKSLGDFFLRREIFATAEESVANFLHAA